MHISDTKLVAEVLDVITGGTDSYSSNYFIEDATFCSLATPIGHKHGWDTLKSPFQTHVL